MFPVDAKSQALLGLANNRDPLPGLGTILHKTKNCMKCTFDWVANGSAVGSYLLLDDQGNPAILPLNAIVTNVTAIVLSAVTSGGAATLALGSNIAAATADLMAATGKASFTLGAFVAGAPIGTAATWVGPVTSQAGSQLQATVGTAALTAGTVEFIVEYIIK